MIELSKGNSKTGPAFSLPEGITCSGKTSVCIANCYVKFGRMALPVVRDKRTRNLKAVTGYLKLRGIEGRIALGVMLDKAIKDSDVSTLRIHDSGDFFSEDYTRAWIMAASRNEHVEFWAYTRSFTVPNLVPALVGLAGMPNVAIWLSADADNWVSAPAMLRQYPQFAGIAFMETEGGNDIARIIQKTVVDVDEKLRNCPAITHEIEASKKNPACLSCRICLPAQGVNQVDKTQLETRARITTRDIRIKLRAALAQQAYLKQSLQALESSALAYAEYGIAINLEQAINCCNQILRAHNAPDVE